MRADHDPALFRSEVQYDQDAQLGRTREPERGCYPGQRVHPAGPDRMLTAAQVFPLLHLCTHVHRTGTFHDRDNNTDNIDHDNDVQR